MQLKIMQKLENKAFSSLKYLDHQDKSRLKIKVIWFGSNYLSVIPDFVEERCD